MMFAAPELNTMSGMKPPPPIATLFQLYAVVAGVAACAGEAAACTRIGLIAAVAAVAAASAAWTNLLRMGLKASAFLVRARSGGRPHGRKPASGLWVGPSKRFDCCSARERRSEAVRWQYRRSACLALGTRARRPNPRLACRPSSVELKLSFPGLAPRRRYQLPYSKAV